MRKLIPFLVLTACSSKVTLQSKDPLLFVARQDDTAWRAVPAGEDGLYTFDAGETYGVAYGCENFAGSSLVTVIYATVSELPRMVLDCALPTTTMNPVEVRGSFTGLSPGTTGRADVASQTALVASDGVEWSVNATAGTHDFFARRMTGTQTWDKIVRKNDVQLAVGTRLNVDFNSEGVSPEKHQVTFTGQSSDETTLVLLVFHNTEGGSPFANGSMDNTYLSMPASLLRPSDGYVATAAANTQVGARSVQRDLKAGVDFTAALPAMPPDPGVTVAGDTPYVRLQGSSQTSDDPDVYSLTFQQVEADMKTTHAWTIRSTRQWLKQSQETTSVIPDVSAAAGFKTRWALEKGREISWQQLQQKSSAGLGALFDASNKVIVEGRELSSTRRQGKIMP